MADRIVKEGIAYIQASFNNTIINVTDQDGNMLCWSSAGKCGFKNSRKATAYAAQLAAEAVAKEVMEKHRMEMVTIKISGPGQGRESAARAIASSNMMVTRIEDWTPNPHNGCKRPKERRV